jgi:hypothetical protein
MTAASLDANAAAGVLRQIFAVDITAAQGKCEGCGRTGAIGGDGLFGGETGVVVRCAGCDAVLIRVVSAPGRTWIDLRGLSYLEIKIPE